MGRYKGSLGQLCRVKVVIQSKQISWKIRTLGSEVQAAKTCAYKGFDNELG